jgi:nitroimidazol reductase NimA-like FMN-containing flavoprotein (pyridoxamine 5'-phosphate oxidase superfamily)
MTIASCRRSLPWAAAVFYASDGFELYFFSKPRSQHGANIAHNPAVSATVHENCRQWRGIRGIQLKGRAELLRSHKVRSCFWEAYRKKFPEIEKFFQERARDGEITRKLAGIRMYRFVPTAAWYLDNSKGFGHREKLELGGKG